MKWIGKIIVCVGIISAILISGLIGISRSLWFLAGTVPATSDTAVIGLRTDGLNTIVRNLHQEHILKDTIAQAIPYISRVVFFQDTHHNQTIVTIPTLSGQIQLPSYLESNGWNTRRYGWLIVASTGQGAHITTKDLQRGVNNFLLNVVNNRMSYHPRAIFSIPANAFIPQVPAFTAVISDTDTGLHAVAVNGVQQFPEIAGQIDNTAPISEESSIFLSKIPTEYITALPAGIQETLQNSIRNNLKLNHVKPRIGDYIEGQNIVLLSQNSQYALVGVMGNTPRFISYMKDQIQQEVGYEDPVKKAFRLPDGTIGFEYVPNNEKDIWENADNSCIKAINKEKQYYICEKNGWAFLSNSSVALGDIEQYTHDNAPEIVIPSQMSKFLPGNIIKTLHIQVGDHIITADSIVNN